VATSIADLLAHLDHVTAGDAISSGDAAACVRVLSRLADNMRQPALGNGERAAVARHFADACRTLAVTFEVQSGRLADAAGVLADACVRRVDQLADDERWTIISQLAVPARRCANAIAACGPYESVPQLLAMIDRTREVILAAADDPPEPKPHGLLTEPIPSLVMLDRTTPEMLAVEAVATIALDLQRHRETFAIRQLLGICVLGEAAARCVHGARCTGAATGWRQVRDELSLFADRPRRDPAIDDPILRTVIQGVESFVEVGVREGSATELTPSLEPLLLRMTLGCALAIERAMPNLLIPHGPRPLREERVADWLTGRTYRAAEDDIRPVLDRFRTLAMSRHDIPEVNRLQDVNRPQLGRSHREVSASTDIAREAL
jgi:hypothetical protein